MKRILFILLFLAPKVFASVYLVEKNDTLSHISIKTHIEIDVISKINDLIDNNIHEGQKLYIPDSIINYNIQYGDNLINIARNHSSKVEYIVQLNNLANETLYVGKQVKIPIVSKKRFVATTRVDVQTQIETITPKEPLIDNKKLIIYTVMPGDTISQIALSHKVSAAEIIKWNKKSTDVAYIGEKLEIFADDDIAPTKLDASIAHETITPKEPLTDNKKLIIYTVMPGDTISQIALSHKVSIAEIIKWSNKSTDIAYIGEKLKIFVDDINTDDIAPTKTDASKAKKTSPMASQKVLHIYTVKKGDNLTHIAKKHNVSIGDIIKWNNKKHTTAYIGEKLKIYIPKSQSRTWTEQKKQEPVKKANLPIQKKKNENKIKKIYTVKSGDNLTHIAKKYNVSINDIVKWNNKKHSVAYIGEKLKIYVDKKTIPKPAPPQNKPVKIKRIYTVKRGDNLTHIARRYKVSVDNIIRWNKKKKRTVMVGEKLKIYTLRNSSPSKPYKLNKKNWDKNFLFPVNKQYINKVCGARHGMEVLLSKSCPVKSVAIGVVEFADFLNGYNQVVVIKYGSKRLVYGYLTDVFVKKNQKVSKGQTIGKVDKSCGNDIILLYLELRK